MSTESGEYATRLIDKQNLWWKRLFRVQALYQWNLRREHLGRTLDVGCGIGRNLVSLDAGSVGVDHNPVSVGHARAQGLCALTVEEFLSSDLATPEGYDSLLLAHVIEHMSPGQARELLGSYLPYVKQGGAVLFICPQERGYASDSTHITWTTDTDLEQLARDTGLHPERSRSFPFPRAAGKAFTYNEFVVRARKG